MIGCDNDLCPIEWFHFNCVQLSTKPKGKWYCPKCRGDKPTLMKPKAQFLKELEKFNKEREEKLMKQNGQNMKQFIEMLSVKLAKEYYYLKNGVY